jgi:Icc-related predicted phosphoesterase
MPGMKILAVSDVEVDMINSPLITQRFNDVDLVISCGDLPIYYLEYIISMLNRPLYYVRGNHSQPLQEADRDSNHYYPWGGIDLHRCVMRDSSGLLLAGIEGSLDYNHGYFQYSQEGMWSMVLAMVPRLLMNRLLYGRYLDVFIAHAPPWRVHDKDDLPHQGIKAFRWLINVFKPAVFLHGHIHIYHQYDVTETQIGPTRVINVYGYKSLSFDLKKGSAGVENLATRRS